MGQHLAPVASTKLQAGAVIVVSIALLASAARVEADHDSRTITGSIELPTPKETGGRSDRCAWMVGGEASRGFVGHMIPLQGSEGCGYHTLRLSRSVHRSSSAPVPDFDIHFYRSPGTCSTESDRTGAFVCSDDSHEFEEWIPTGTRYALVVLATGIEAPPICYGGLCSPPSLPAGTGGSHGFTVTIFPNPVWDWPA